MTVGKGGNVKGARREGEVMVPKCRTIRETVGLRRVRGRYLEAYVKGESV